MLFAVTLAGGGVVTYLPVERPDGGLVTVALLVFGVAAAAARPRSGALADRLGASWLLPLALAVAAAGPVGTAIGLSTGAGWVVIGAGVFGAGFGAVQNLSLIAAFARAGEGGTTTASALWNAAFDAVTAVVALALGFLAAGIGLDRAYVLLAALLVATVPRASAAARVVRS